MDNERLGKALAWFGLGLGAAEIIAPRTLAQMIGTDGNESQCAIIRAMGVREVASGVAILMSTNPGPWLWGRVAGDAMDLTLLGRTLADRTSDRGRVALALAAVSGVTALDMLCSMQASGVALPATAATEYKQSAEENHNMDIKQAITINRPAADLYQFWHRFENLPQFMSHLKSVQTNGDGRSHWVVAAPAGTTVEWDAEVIQDQPNELIAWRSLANATVTNAGLVRFAPAPGNRGTEIHVELSYDPPAGAVGAAMAKLFGEEPNQQVHDDLRHLKQVLETGEIVRSDASVRGGGPAQPMAQDADQANGQSGT